MWKWNPNEKNGRWIALAETCLAVGLVLGIAFSTGWRNQQALFGDFLVGLAPKPTLPVGVALVGIDASSLNLDGCSPEEIASSRALVEMKKGFPWSRAVYADAIEKLVQAGAKLILLDVFLLGPRNGDNGDEALHKVLEKYGERIILISTFTEDANHKGNNIQRYQMPCENIITSTPVHIGCGGLLRDEDQVVRLTKFRWKLNFSGDSIPSVAAVMFGMLAGKEKQAKLPEMAAFIPGRQGLQEKMNPLWELFLPKSWTKNLKNGEVFRDKVVVIGSYFTTDHDEFQTANGVMPGMAIHLAVLAAAWQQAFYSMPGWAARGLAAFLAALAAWLIALTFRNIIFRSIAYGIAVALVLAGGGGALVWLHAQIPLLPILSGLLVGGVGTLVVDLVAEARERLRARHYLERYVGPGVVREILDRHDSFLASLGGSRREVTVLFADLRGFTSLAELTEPVDLLAELNDYLGRMTTIIHDAGGGVDKFLGDGILAVWGTLEESSSTRALVCSQRMLEELTTMNAMRVPRGKPEWRLGIGIHKGHALFGNVGSQKKMEPTVIGDTVNLASRTEGLNKSYGTGVLFTRSVRDDSGMAEGEFRSVDRIRVVGRSQAVDLFTFWDATIPPDDRIAYERAVDSYRTGEISRAASVFQTLQAARPNDSLFSLYAERCLAWEASPPQEPWDGISNAQSK